MVPRPQCLHDILTTLHHGTHQGSRRHNAGELPLAAEWRRVPLTGGGVPNVIKYPQDWRYPHVTTIKLSGFDGFTVHCTHLDRFATGSPTRSLQHVFHLYFFLQNPVIWLLPVFCHQNQGSWAYKSGNLASAPGACAGRRSLRWPVPMANACMLETCPKRQKSGL